MELVALDSYNVSIYGSGLPTSMGVMRIGDAAILVWA